MLLYVAPIFIALTFIGLIYLLPRRKSPLQYLRYPNTFRGKNTFGYWSMPIFAILYLYGIAYWLLAMVWIDIVPAVALAAACLSLAALIRWKWPRTVFFPWYAIAWLIPCVLVAWTIYFQFGKKYPLENEPPEVIPLLRLENDSWRSILESRVPTDQVDFRGVRQQPRAMFPSALPGRYYFTTGSETDGYYHLLMRYNLDKRELEMAQVVPGSVFRGACDRETKRCYFAMTENNERPGERINAIMVYDEEADRYLDPIDTWAYPRTMDIDSVRRRLYAGLFPSQDFFVILDADTGKVRLPREKNFRYSAGGPCTTWTNPASGRTYATIDQFLSPVYIYDPETDRLLGHQPPLWRQLFYGYGITLGLGTTPDDRDLYIAYPISGFVIRYRLPDFRVIATRWLEPGARELVVPAETRCLFVGGFNLGNLYVLDKQTLTVLKRTHVGFRLRQFLYLPESKAVLLGDSKGYSLVDVSDVCY